MLKKAGEILEEICRKIGCSANVGKRALAIVLALALVTAAAPAIGVTADAETVNASDNKGFSAIAYDQSARIQVPKVSGAQNYKVYLSQNGNLTSFSGAECVFDSGYESYAYTVNGDKDAANSSNTISISENNTYYFYLVTNNGSTDTVQSSVKVATRLKGSCYWTSPGVYDSGWYNTQTGNTYTISTAAQLAGLAVLVNGGNDFSGKTVKLSASVDLSAYLWTPMGTADMTAQTTSPFNGTFDGGNNVVCGLHTNDGTKYLQGLFGYADTGSTIKNVGVVNGSVKGAEGVGAVTGYTGGSIANCYNTGVVSGAGGVVGGIAGDSEGDSSTAVTNCYNTGWVSGADDDVGGVVGKAENEVTDCYNIGSVSSTGNNVGGVMGYGDGGGGATNCYNTGSVSSTGNYVGGIAGEIYEPTIKNCYNTGSVRGNDEVGGVTGDVYDCGTAVENSYNTGSVSGTGSDIGGVAGVNRDGTIQNSYNAGAVNGTGNYEVGGIAGENAGKVTNCYNTGSVSGTGSDIGGVAGANNGGTIQNCYNTGSVTGTGSSTASVGGAEGGTNNDYKIKNSYSAGKVNGSEKDIYYGTVQNVENTFPDKSALLSYINGDSAFCAAPTPYANGGVFSASNPVNQGYPVLRSFGYTDGTSGHGFSSATITVDSDTGVTVGTDYGDGTSNNPYIIRNAYQMDLVRNYLGNSGSGKYFQLAGNIDLSPAQYGKTQNVDGSWKPIGTFSFGFFASFNGNSCSISGIYISYTEGDQGLFGYTGSVSSIKNLGVSGDNIHGTSFIGGVVGEAAGAVTTCYSTGAVSGNSYVGSVAGAVEGALTDCYNTGAVGGTDCIGGIAGDAVTITNCCNTGAVSGTGRNVGGIAGLVAGAVTDCYNTGSVSGTGQYVGGVAGNILNNVAVTNCYNTGAVSVSGTGNEVGGVAGRAATITACYNAGMVSVSGTGNGVGGVAGTAVTIITCYNAGTVSSTGESSQDVGGVAGNAESNGTISNCYNTGSVSGSGKDVGGVAGTARKVTTCYSVGPVSGTFYVGGVVGQSNCGTLSDNYYSGYSGGVGQDGRTAATDAENGTIPFVSCVNPGVGKAETIKELAADELKADFKAAFGITAIQYPDGYESSEPNILTVSGKTVTRTAQGNATVTGKAGAHSNADIIISQNALNRTDATSGFSGAGTATVSGIAIVTFTTPQTGTNKQLNSMIAPTGITGVAGGAAKTADGLRLPPTVILVTNNGNVSAGVTWNVNSCAYDPSKTAAQTFTVSGTVNLPAGITNPNNVPLTISAQVTVGASSGGGNPSSFSSSGTKKSTPPAPTSATSVDAFANTATVKTQADSVTVNGNAAEITVTVPTVTADTTGTNAVLDAGKKASVEINLPKDTVLQQLSAKKDVNLTITVPHDVAKDANANTAIDIKIDSDILAAAKASQSDITIKIKDADTQQLAYSWTFKGSDLAKSTAPVTDVNISMAVRLTTEVPKVNVLTPNNLGLVLLFDHSGTLPSMASVTFSAKEKGFQPGQKLYFYYYNPQTGQIDAQNQEYTVDANGNVTVQISHCSNYVLLPHKVRTITLDTRTYTMPVGNSYITGVKLTGVSGAKLKAYSSTKGVAAVTVLSNGNVKAKALKPGLTYVMIDVYDDKGKFLTHASVRLTVKKIVKPNGNSARQFGIF